MSDNRLALSLRCGSEKEMSGEGWRGADLERGWRGERGQKGWCLSSYSVYLGISRDS